MTNITSLELVAVPILVQGEKLLKHVASIDVPVKRYYVLDNSEGRDPTVADAIDELYQNPPANIEEISVVENYLNAGYPGSVNQIIRDNTDCEQWIVSCFDWWAAPGEYQKILDYTGDLSNGAFFGQGGDAMCTFMFTPNLIDKVGMVDENFFPGYFEDNDYRRRIDLSGLKVASIPLQSEHDRSSTLNSSQRFKQRNQFTFQKNHEYYMSKWGGNPGAEIYVKPFNSNVPLDYWKFDPKRREKLRW